MKILFLFGTRPEAIKMAPLIQAFQSDGSCEICVCITAQHRQMLDQVLNFFELPVHYDLNLMQPDQTLFELTANALTRLEPILEKEKPDLVFVQGDTTTVLTGALAAYYKKIKIAHLEAGLRSHDMFAPFPEEANRKLTGHLAHFHFAPTEQAALNLYNENIRANVHVVGNTVIDALHKGLKKTEASEQELRGIFSSVDFSKKIVLVTCHRRESFGAPFVAICEALKEIAETNPEATIVYPVHLNPNIKQVAEKLLGNTGNIRLIAPLPYHQLIWLMNKSYLILTDSGGIQEEAPSLGKPVLVLREVTERMEGVQAGTAKLLGTDKKRIVAETSKLLHDQSAYDRMANAVNPYGDGNSSQKIVEIIKTAFNAA